MGSGLIGFLVLFALLFLGVPIAFGLVIVGFAGFAMLNGLEPALAMVGQITFTTVLNEDMSVIPLFVLMGGFITLSRLSDDLYDAANALLGRFRGGLAMATVLACAGFASVCGSSFATVATISKVAMPPMRRYRYADSLATGSIASGSTLGIMIPPSVPLLIYGILTRTDVGVLFIAGVLPGLLGGLLYIAAIVCVTWRNPDAGPPGQKASRKQVFDALRGVWAVATLFVCIIGGIYLGVFTANEAAGIGAAGGLVFALARKSVTWSGLIATLVDSAKTTGIIFFVLIGALMFGNFIDIVRLPQGLTEWIGSSGLAPLAVILAILAIYLVLGCVLDSMSMLLLTVPLFYPIVQGLGFSLVWFGILVVTMIEISLITPPVGLNVFVLKSLVPDVSTGTIFRGVVPFVSADMVRVALLVLFPGIALLLPRLMGS